MAVNTVEAGVESTAKKPGIIAIDEGADVDSVEVLVPRQQLVREFPPELLRMLNGLCVAPAILVEVL